MAFKRMIVYTKISIKLCTLKFCNKVYKRLILDTLKNNESYIDGLINVYNNPICEIIDNYDCGAYYEPSYVISRAYNEGSF